MTYGHHVVALHVRLVLVLALVVKFAEEIEGDDGVEIDDHGQQAHRHHQLQQEEGRGQRSGFKRTNTKELRSLHLFAVVRDRGQDGAQSLHTHGDVQ